QEAPPCDSVTAPAAQQLTFLAGAHYVRRNPDEEGTYTVEQRPTPAGGDEVLIRFDNDSPAQLRATADSLVISWAYVDGPELRYVPIGNH
ncbi:MAG TPA: hypothetical protein VM778_09615, partial [Gemmatimonadota bacterium]|nr:hypothetical protein [Gemmatimonadota bacterium]